jgi:PAS domain S-box-containing protein
MRVLEVLAERSGFVVAKDEFMDKVWPNTYVGEDALVRCVGRLRKAFDDADAEIIETVPKKGYRMVAPIQGRGIDSTTIAPALEAVLAVSTDHIFIYDREGRYLFVSKAGSKALGFEPRDMIGKTWRELGMPASVMEPFQRQVDAVFKSVGFIRDTVRSGSIFGPREFEYVLDPIRVGDEVVAVIACVRDVTGGWMKDKAIEQLPRLAELDS